ncbi:hypothetical protein KQQ74_001629 [Escherichia coli]|nr:hypothetical protein [Escherichia coli]EFH6897809.1 hypothetical protein [Escherichia coli]EHK6946982.1 hypothetical protein [Escherichia coli]EHR9697505.1 hypothetical protein [Escherichia coli]EHS5519182.1 hypothetical protein [Escherichia coli]
MSYIRVEKDGLQYGAEYFREEDMVTVFGVRGGHSSVVLNGMTEVAAARTALRNLIRENQVDPLTD